MKVSWRLNKFGRIPGCAYEYGGEKFQQSKSSENKFSFRFVLVSFDKTTPWKPKKEKKYPFSLVIFMKNANETTNSSVWATDFGIRYRGLFLGFRFGPASQQQLVAPLHASSVWLNIVSIDISILQSIFVAQVKLGISVWGLWQNPLGKNLNCDRAIKELSACRSVYSWPR